MLQREESSNDARTLIHLRDFGAKPDSGEDALPAMRRAIEEAARRGGAARLVCEPGRYEFFAERASKVPYWITNTTSEEENPDVTKTIGILLKGLRNIALDGQGALFVFHGKMTMLAIDGCENVEIRNVRFDYEWPTVAEMSVERIGDGYMDVRPHPSSRYQIADGKLYWAGPGWGFRDGPMQEYDPGTNRTWRIDNWIERAKFAEEIEPSLVRLRFGPDAGCVGYPNLGSVLQARDGTRDQVGVFVRRSRNVSFAFVGLHFMHGLGVVGQFSENVSFEAVEIAPRPETGRTVAGFADGIHLSGCRGRIRIDQCRFEGLHDDGVNVHGTYLRVVRRIGARRLRLRFMHPQTYGFEAFIPGDGLEFVRSGTLEACGAGTVASAKLVSPREIELTLSDDVPVGVGEGDAVENVTWTPELEIRGCTFARIPTRGILATTRRRIVIEDNIFDGTRMSAILVAGEAGSWYESGPVRDMIVRGNRFASCGGDGSSVILIEPEVLEANEMNPVHGGIAIEENLFELDQEAALAATSVRSLSFRGNELRLRGGIPEGENRTIDDMVRLKACSQAILSDNRIGTIV